MRVAVAHDWLTGMRGGERVLEALLDLFPGADLYTLVHAPGSVSRKIESRRIHTSFLDRLPGGRTHYRHLLPLFPAAAGSLQVRDADLLVSVSTCAAKAIRPPDGARHVCYCNTPMRYVWDRYDDYFGPGRASPPVRFVAGRLAKRLREWDRDTAGGVEQFIANSHHIQDRIRRCWGRDSVVVYPPVDVGRFRPRADRRDFYLYLGALVPYKRIDIAVAAFNRLRRPLVIAGDGSEMRKLAAAAGPTISFTGRVSDPNATELLERCRALVLPGVEDFGIAPLEAQAAGAPVIAFGEGGVLETVVPAGRRGNGSSPPQTGVFFSEQTPESLAAAVEEFESLSFDPAVLRANADRFGIDRFRTGVLGVVRRMAAGAADAPAAAAVP